MGWEWVGLTSGCTSAFDIAADLRGLHSFLLALCPQEGRDTELRPVLQSLDQRRATPEKAKTSSRAEDRARRWSRPDGRNEEVAPFARGVGGLILSSAEAAWRAKLGWRSTKQCGLGRGEVGWGQRAVLQAVRPRGVKTLSIRTRPPSPQSLGNATLPSSLATASQGGAPRQDPSRGASTGNQQ